MLSRVWLFATPWSVGCQAPLSMGFSRQEYWSGLPYPSLGDLPDPGIEPASRMFLALAEVFSTTRAAWEAREVHNSWEPSCGLNQGIILASRSGWSLTVTIQGKDGWTMILLVKHSSFLIHQHVSAFEDLTRCWYLSRNGNLLQYFCLGNPIDKGVWRATVYGVTKSWTQLNDGAHMRRK